MMKILSLALLATAVSGYVAPRPLTSRPATQLQETFGLGIGEDNYANQPAPIAGEAAYKEWVNKVNEDNMLNRKYNVIRRVRELDLLRATADNEVLSKLEANGVDLELLEELLPAVEKAGLLSLAGNNQQLLINLVAPLLVEGAPFLLPVVAGALGVGPPAFFLGAAAFGGLEAFLIANNVEVPFVGLPAAGVLGLVLVPLTVVSAGVGVALASAKK